MVKTLEGRRCGNTPDTQEDGVPSARDGEASSAASAARRVELKLQLELLVGLGATGARQWHGRDRKVAAVHP